MTLATNAAQHGALVAMAGAFILALVWFALWLIKTLILHLVASWAANRAAKAARRRWGRPAPDYDPLYNPGED